MDRGDWQAMVHGVAKSCTRLKCQHTHTYTHTVNLRKMYNPTVVLEKTLESPLDCKEIQLVHLEGNQS